MGAGTTGIGRGMRGVSGDMRGRCGVTGGPGCKLGRRRTLRLGVARRSVGRERRPACGGHRRGSAGPRATGVQRGARADVVGKDAFKDRQRRFGGIAGGADQIG